MQSVEVLCSRGRVFTTKVPAKTSLMEILKQACAFDGTAAVHCHTLRRGRATVDLSTTLAFAGIPNNCRLELVGCTSRTINAQITVCVQESAELRHQDTFPASTSLWQVLTTLADGRLTQQFVDDMWQEPVVIYTRTEVAGIEPLHLTTLETLGLSGGKVLLRIRFKPTTLTRDELAHALQQYTNASAPSPEVTEKHFESVIEQVKREATQITSEPVVIEQVKEEPLQMASATVTTTPAYGSDESHAARSSMEIDQVETAEDRVPSFEERMAKSEFANFEFPTTTAASTVTPTQRTTPYEPLIVSHETRMARSEFAEFDFPAPSGQSPATHPVLSPSTTNESAVVPVSRSQAFMNPEFANFDWPSPPATVAATSVHPVSQRDGSSVRLINSQPSQSISHEIDEELVDVDPTLRAPCDRQTVVIPFEVLAATSTADEEVSDAFFEHTKEDLVKLHKDFQQKAQDSEEPLMTKTLRKAKQHEKALRIRQATIRFAFPDRLHLQATFHILEPVSYVYEFIRHTLGSDEFELFTTPPRLVLPKESKQSIFSLSLYPAAIVHVTGPASANSVTLKNTFPIYQPTTKKPQVDERDSSTKTTQQQLPQQRTKTTSSASTDAKNAKVPKWFKQ